MKIYIACGLTHVPRPLFDQYARFLHGLARNLAESDFSRTIKYALVHSDPQLAEKPPNQRARLCYLWDRGMVEEADLVVAECSHPSIGLGIELQIAEAKDTPIVICYRRDIANRAERVEYVNPDHTKHELQIGDGYVSLMALGLPSVIKVVEYATDEEGFRQIGAAIDVFKRGA